MSIAVPPSLRSHLRVYTVAHGTPRTFWRPIDGYLFTFETPLILQHERGSARPFSLFLPAQTMWPLRARRLMRFVTAHKAGATIRWASAEKLCALMDNCPDFALYCIERMSRSEAQLSEQLGYALHRSLLPRTAWLLLRLWELSDKRFIYWTQAELATALNVYRESMTVVLGELQQRGLIRLHYRRIEVLDRWALQRVAEAY